MLSQSSRRMKLHALSITRWKHSDASIKEPVHLSFAVDLSQLSFFQRGTVKEITALVLRTCVGKTNPGDYQVPSTSYKTFLPIMLF